MLSQPVSISAVIPTYNRGHLIQRAIKSVLEQTRPPKEVIVVDDGSLDDTRERVSLFGDLVKYIHQDNKGSAIARNRGIESANSEWVALLDSDDIWLEEHLERVTHAIEATSGKANYYFADTIQPPEKGGGRLWQALDFQISGEYELRENGSEWALMGVQPMMLQSTIFKRAAFLEAGAFLEPLRYRDDTHMFLKLGLGQALCAVVGCGVKMSADDDPQNRLTLSYNRTKSGTIMQVVMNQDLLDSLPNLDLETRKLLQKRLARAHWALARFAWRDRSFSEFLFQAGQSVRVQPRLFVSRLGRIGMRRAAQI
jgi:glycosyltransferase involved in cell wall biosynthesis